MRRALFKVKRVIQLDGYYSWFRVERELSKIVAKYRYAIDDDVEEVGLRSYGHMQPETILLVKQEGNSGFIATVRYRFVPHNNLARNKFKLSFPHMDDIQLLTEKMGFQNTSNEYSPHPVNITLIVLDRRSTPINGLPPSMRQHYYDLEACEMIENVSSFSDLRTYLHGDSHA